MQRGERVADRQVRPHRRPIGIAGDVAQPAHGLADRAEARLIAVGAGLPEPRQAQHDQPGIFRGQALVTQAPFFQRAGTEILDHDVRIPCHARHDLLAFGSAQIDGHRFLVAVLHIPPQRRALVELAPFAQGIAIRRLDLDHLGAELGEELSGKGARNELPQLQHLYSLEGLAHTGLRSANAWASVPVSTYSSSPPTGMPRAIREMLTPQSLRISPI